MKNSNLNFCYVTIFYENEIENRIQKREKKTNMTMVINYHHQIIQV